MSADQNCLSVVFLKLSLLSRTFHSVFPLTLRLEFNQFVGTLSSEGDGFHLNSSDTIKSLEGVEGELLSGGEELGEVDAKSFIYRLIKVIIDVQGI